MKIHDKLQQGSWEWLAARAGKVTASELGNLITDGGKIRGWGTAMPNSYLHLKLAEAWRSQPLQSFMGNQQTDQGQLYEEQARSYFAALLDTDITEIGGIESDDGKLWVSPDGVIAENTGLEIKVPNINKHFGWLLEGGLPEEHRLQVEFSLFVSGWKSWRFLSYCKDAPHLAITVEPDPALQATIADAVSQFQMAFDAAWKKLCDLNGGEPVKPAPPSSSEPVKFSWDNTDKETLTDIIY